MNMPLTKAAQDRAALITLAHELASLANQIEADVCEGAYVAGLGHSQLALNQLCALKVKLERAAQAQRN